MVVIDLVRAHSHCGGNDIFFIIWDFNECVHFRTDLFDSMCQSDLLNLIAIKFDEYSLVRAGHLFAE